MVDNNWAIELPTQIFTLVKTRVQKKINAATTKYPNIFWTMDGSINKTPVFPTIYVVFDCYETGNDLNNRDINAIDCTAQVDITVSKEQGLSGARYIAGMVMEEFKELGFTIRETPNFNDGTLDTKRMVFRASRVIGQADVIYS